VKAQRHTFFSIRIWANSNVIVRRVLFHLYLVFGMEKGWPNSRGYHGVCPGPAAISTRAREKIRTLLSRKFIKKHEVLLVLHTFRNSLSAFHWMKWALSSRPCKHLSLLNVWSLASLKCMLTSKVSCLENWRLYRFFPILMSSDVSKMSCQKSRVRELERQKVGKCAPS